MGWVPAFSTNGNKMDKIIKTFGPMNIRKLLDLVAASSISQLMLNLIMINIKLEITLM